MKKIILISSIIFIILLTSVTYGANIELNLHVDKQNYTITEDGQILEILVQLGNFITIPEGTALGYTAILEYDENIFEDVTVAGENDWDVLYNNTNHMLQGDIGKANANTTITKIKLKLKEENIKQSETTKIALKDVIISDGNFEIKYDKEIEIKIENKTVQEKTQQIKDYAVLTGGTSLQAMSESGQTTKLPDTGLGKAIPIAIGILFICMIIFRIGARKIK